MATETTQQTQPDAEAEIPGTWIEGEYFPYFLSPEQTRAEFEELAQEYFGISGAEFVRRLDAGEYDEVYDDPAYLEVMRLESYARLFR